MLCFVARGSIVLIYSFKEVLFLSDSTPSSPLRIAFASYAFFIMLKENKNRNSVSVADMKFTKHLMFSESMVTEYLIFSCFFLILCCRVSLFVILLPHSNNSLMKMLYDQEYATVTATKTKKLVREFLQRAYPLSGANLLLVRILEVF